MRTVSLCTGYGGLDKAVAQLFPAELVAVSDIDKGACKILAHRYPTVPNIGDFTTYDWTGFECDILTAGFPCQPVSHAGQRKGTTDERWLFDDIVDAVSRMGTRPRLLVFENVRGLLTANGGDAMARVVQGLASIGYVGQYRVLRASDVGAAHRRERVFIVAHPAANAGGEHGEQWRIAAPRQAQGGRSLGEFAGRGRASAGVALLPTPMVKNNENRQSDGYGPNLGGAIALLPTPAVNDMGAGKTVEAWDEWTAKMQAKHSNGNGHGASLAIEAMRLLPTPRASDGTKGGPNQAGSSGDLMLPSAVQPQNWGIYTEVVERWERVLGRVAPAPTEAGPKGGQRLAPRFVEWMMGLNPGHVTDVPGLTRNEQLKALGNGVVPQQAEAALRSMLGQVAA